MSAANQFSARTYVHTAPITRARSWLCFFAPDTTRITMLGLLIHKKNRVSGCVCSAAEEFETILICTKSLCLYSQGFHSYKQSKAKSLRNLNWVNNMVFNAY